MLHNHPNLSKILLEDVAFFLKYAAVKMIVAVTNRGSLGYIVKTDKYNRLKALEILKEAIIMKEYNCILSEKPDALDGALEWIEQEIEKEKAIQQDKKRITQKLKAEVRPLVIKIAESRGLVTK